MDNPFLKKNITREKHRLFPPGGRKTSFAKSLLSPLAKKFFFSMAAPKKKLGRLEKRRL